jgi:antitoxin MazE
MKTRIVRIGRSQGVRIPKALLEQTGLRGEVEISIEGNALVIRAAEPANGSGEAPGAARKKGLPLPPYEKLRRLAKKYPPPASWFEEGGKPF